MSKLWEFFQEDSGTLSATRLIFVIGSLFSMAMGAWVFASTQSYAALIAVTGSLTATYTAGKLIQKPLEKSSNTP